MLPSVTYQDYETYGGKLSEVTFDASLRTAISCVREVIGFNVPESDSHIEAYRNAVCSAVDVDAAYGCSGGIQEGGSSMSIGSFSVGNGNASASSLTDYDRDMQRRIRQELAGSGLLYQGIA